MDLSAVIFVVLALAWAVYLIPKALKHHDEMASDRLVEGHSDRVRILSRHRRTTPAAPVAPVAPETLETADEPAKRTSATPVTRSAAGQAAQRRRRVLGVLLIALVAVWGFTWFGYLPSWAPAIPGALVVAWLVLARLSVRRAKARRSSASPRPRVEPAVDEPAGWLDVEPVAEPVGQASAHPVAEPVAESGQRVSSSSAVADASPSQDLIDLLVEDTGGAQREEIEAAIAEEGSLWDPLPLTLPTYVNKARARRTVRTIELTGVKSSGHDDADTALATTTGAAEAAADTEAERRKASGA